MNIIKFLKKPSLIFFSLGIRGFFNWLPDDVYLKIAYRIRMGKKLDLNNPQCFTEKLQWIKLNDRKEIYHKMVDKYEAKEYVANIIGGEYIIPTLGVWNSYDEIDFDSLPEQFVLKCTHDSGGIFICKDKSTFDFEIAKKRINNSIKRNYYYNGREWPYINVKPRIIAEPYIVDSNYELNDYKFFCFNGKVRCLKIDFDRFKGHRANYYDVDMKILPFGEVICPPKPERKFDKPKEFYKMINFAEVLSKDVNFLRVDFYDVDGQVYFGELTFFPASGLGKFTPTDWDDILGSWMVLPIDKE